ncbi:bifunctional UDP-N-acetylglucosamine diphosphorylase/glucosamine-1-phosphate N-acetyltransferase GlmU [Vitreoscilla stercoraria]|uniref:Bifunctional protein GlmU n=1 Tax=Vitreoscilla stercoraria TaxID=61 RepID=A0ABY4E8S7_VITST|nr:bifunctional UDP-N-acetylglucosamine diphosphorylase/glucosamine-1-phosphate N-acetyltransferase GlmU [Vitreoscilla stercoraria]UOO92161.1 bifunctional UDP-N-acetylglucosamine diphosphorylase/glucosamine-1-phosphate N-acetyltransferase GlmU [Vitreoscilla stercoraria]
MNDLLHIVILAAGKGTRMYSKLPKVLHQIGGIPLVQHVINTAQSLQPASIQVVIGHGKELVQDQIQSPVTWVIQDQQLGTGHAVKCALPHLPKDGKTLILYGDVPLTDAATLKQLLDLAGNEVGLLTDVLEQPQGYGRIIRNEQGICAIVEEKDADANQKQIQEINTGILVLPNAKLEKWLNTLQNSNAQGEYYLTDVIALAVQDGVTVHGMTVRASHLAAGINNKLQLAEIERIYQAEQAKALMTAGITLRDPNRFDLRGTLQHGLDCIIDVNVVIEGDCVLGDDVHIGANCVLNNATIGSGCQIAPFSHLSDCVVGTDARIGPFARLRPNAQLGNDVHIGNFVEVKNSQIGNGSKVNHLSYIGDAQIGTQSNIGAGTITCNYDGVNKFKTTIGDHVRIGSGSMLVAPVTIHNLVTTGAGSVITKDCPENHLSIGRARQTNIANWKRPEKQNK